MLKPVKVFLALAAALSVTTSGPAQPEVPVGRFIFEGARTDHYSAGPEGITLRRGSGWLRYSRVVLDFQLSFEYRLSAKDADAGVVFRSWLGRGGWPGTGYRLRLPHPDRPPSAPLLAAHRLKLAVHEASVPVLLPAAEWQRVTITAEREGISVTINDAPAGRFEVGSYGGHILVDCKNGALDLRRISIRELEVSPAARMRAEKPDPSSAGVTMPEVVSETRPVYTLEATRRRVEGTIEIEAVVLPDGRVGETRVVKSLDADLDRSAMAAVRAWRFRPGTKEGRPVPTLVMIELTFRLR